jgi:2-dehydro-3-deoxygalactonokinase
MPCRKNKSSDAGVNAGAVLGDWGNSRLRLWRMQGGAIAERREAPASVAAGEPSAILESLLAGWNAVRVTLCGMAGARNGLRETSYVRCPAGPAAWRGQAVEFDCEERTLRIAPGIAADEPFDVMRGEETQVFGAMTLHPSLSSGAHLLLLPGTHSKWVELDEGRIVRFQTYMTGELFELLGQSTLFMVGTADAEPDSDGFAAGLARAAEQPGLTRALFEARAAQLLAGRTSSWARAFVSGLLIGAEILARSSLPKEVVVIGDPRLTASYGEALAHFGVGAATLDGEACAIAGLRLFDADD